MTAVRLTPQQARRLLALQHDAATHVPAPPTAQRARRPSVEHLSTCHDCGERFTTEAGAARHNADSGHSRFQLELNLTSEA